MIAMELHARYGDPPRQVKVRRLDMARIGT